MSARARAGQLAGAGGGRSSYVVVDASVSLKWALDDEDHVGEAVALRDAAIRGRFAMVAPSLWLYEVANGLAMAVRRSRLSPEIGGEALSHLLAVGVRLADPDVRDVYVQALRFDLTAYDAAYLALAEALGGPLWTGDQRLHGAVRHTVDFVHWIGSYVDVTPP